MSNGSRSSSMFSKCLIVVLIAVLVAFAAVFLYFAVARQTHPQNGPAQNTGKLTLLLLSTSC